MNPSGSISGFVAKAIALAGLRPSSQILDLPSGTGRHALWLADKGYDVTAIDIDEGRIRQCRATSRAYPERGSIQYVVGNANGGVPFALATFDAAIIVHFVSKGLLGRVTPLLRPNGHLIYETFGGQGENWRALPHSCETRDEIAGAFDVVYYRERYVGPSKQSVAVRLLARLKPSPGIDREIS